MFKVGDYTITSKDLVLAFIFLLVGVLAILAMTGSKPKPIVLSTAGAGGEVLASGGQPGSGNGQFAYPRGLALDADGNLYVADSRNHRIQKISVKTGKFVKAFGEFASVTGDAKKLASDSLGKLNEPNGVTVGPDGLVYVIDTWNERIQVFTQDGKFKRAFTSDDGFYGPREILVDANGSIYVADTGRHRIVKFNAKGQKVGAWGQKGKKIGEFNEPIGLAMDQAGNLYVADRLNFRIQVFDPNGSPIKQWKVHGWSKDQVDMEPHLAVDKARGILYATDGRGSQILCYKLDGKELPAISKDAAGNPIVQVPVGVAVDAQGNLYVTDARAGKIFKLAGQTAVSN
ncbi:MAG TPA: NHL repeat-containing protein [bacterium]|nr:NHL repeat-containing protein [bacterium]